MSDMGRKDLGDKVHDSVKPDSQKGLAEQAGDKLSGATDSVSKTLQPEDSKSGTQKTADTVTGGGNDAKKEGEGLLDKTKDTLGLKK